MRAKTTKKAVAAPSVSYEDKLLERLKDPKYAATYLTRCFDAGGDLEEEFEIFFAALGDIFKAHGVAMISEKMGVTRDSVYKMIDSHKNPKALTLAKALRVLDLRIAIVPRKGATTQSR